MRDDYGQAGYEADQAARLEPLVDGLLAWFRDGRPAGHGHTEQLFLGRYQSYGWT